MNKEIFAYVARVTIMAATMVAAIVVMASHDKSRSNSIACLTNHKIWTGFTYFAVMHLIACIYNLLVLMFVRKGSGLWPFVLFLDLILLLLLSTSWAASLTSYMYMKNGNSNVGWPGVCNFAPDQFCIKILWALVTSGIGCFLSFVLFCLALEHAVDYLLVQHD